jgi:hypothetical protein
VLDNTTSLKVRRLDGIGIQIGLYSQRPPPKRYHFPFVITKSKKYQWPMKGEAVFQLTNYSTY